MIDLSKLTPEQKIVIEMKKKEIEDLAKQQNENKILLETQNEKINSLKETIDILQEQIGQLLKVLSENTSN